MGLIKSLAGTNSQNANANTGFSGNEFNGPTSINGNNYNWNAIMRGDCSSVRKLSEEEAKAAEGQARQMKKQTKFYGRKNLADTQSMESAVNIHNSEQFHARKRLDLGLKARGEAIDTQRHVNEKVKPQFHHQNEKLALSQVQGEVEIAKISEDFAKRRETIKNWRKAS